MSLTVLSGSSWPLNVCPSSGKEPHGKIYRPQRKMHVWRWVCVLAFCRCMCVCVCVHMLFQFPDWSIMLQLMQQLGEYLPNNLPIAARSSLTCTQTNTAWPWFYCSHIKLLFWGGNLSQSLLICLAFSVPIRDSSPWQTNKPLLGVLMVPKCLKETILDKAEQSTMRLNPFLRNKCTPQIEGVYYKLLVETPRDSVSV